MTVAIPHVGDYYIPAKYLLSHILNATILVPPKITDRTIQLGSKNSPDFVCMPFKYTLGNFIEALDMGADVLLQLGGGCRYGYYSELQIQILNDLGYKFKYINLVSKGKANISEIISKFESLGLGFKKIKSLYYFIITTKMIKYMDYIDNFIRENIGFEVKKKSFINLKEEMLNSFLNCKGFFSLYIRYKKYKKKFKKIKIKKNSDSLRVGIIGELYTVMEPSSNYELEYMLASYNISIKRFTNAHYLLFEKGREVKKYIKKMVKYIKYRMGADALDNAYRCLYLCKNDYDGIIHIKSSFCTPEIGVMPILNKICNEYDKPIMFFSFDSGTSRVGIQTRVEAFKDMIEMRHKNE